MKSLINEINKKYKVNMLESDIAEAPSKNDARIEKLVASINMLIKNAIDTDGDPIGITDTTGTWPEPYIYSPIEYKNGALKITSRSVYSNKPETEIILKRNMQDDGIPTLRDISKLYKRALKRHGIELNDLAKESYKSNDRDHDGDNDFADVQIARMMASGMSREDAISKTKNKSYNEQNVPGTIFTKDAQEAEKLARKGINVKITETDDIDEISTSGGAGAYMTPKAFGAKKKKKLKYPGVAEAMDKKYETLIESYKKFAVGDSKTTPDKKVKETIKDVSKKLQEIEQLVNYSSRLKNESGLSRQGYGPAVETALHKISERLIKISERVRALGE